MLKNFTYIRATSVNDAVRKLSSPNAYIHAGGTDLLGCLRDDVFDADTVVSISDLEELKGITKPAGGGVRIGALTTIAEIAEDSLIREKYSVLAQAANEIASPQLRNQGTIGGNICQRPRCWYYRGDFDCAKKGGDTCYAYEGENQFHCIFGGDPCFVVYPSDAAPALMSLGAKVTIAGTGGSKTISLDQFCQLPRKGIEKENVLAANEMVTEILLPPSNGSMKSAYRKVRARRVWDFALASAAIALVVDGGVVSKANIVLGGVAPIPWRAAAAEEALTGKRLDDSSISVAAKAAVKGAEPLESNGYKVDLVKGIIEEELAALA